MSGFPLSPRPMSTNTPSIHQLKRALEISEQIEKLQAEFASVFGGAAPVTTTQASAKPAAGKGRSKMSPEAREKIAAAARARWAKIKGTSPAPEAKAAAAPKKKGGLTPEGRAKLAASMKARWAARRKGAPAPTAPKASPAKASAAKPSKSATPKRVISPEARARMIAGAKRRWAAKKKA